MSRFSSVAASPERNSVNGSSARLQEVRWAGERRLGGGQVAGEQADRAAPPALVQQTPRSRHWAGLPAPADSAGYAVPGGRRWRPRRRLRPAGTVIGGARQGAAVAALRQNGRLGWRSDAAPAPGARPGDRPRSSVAAAEAADAVSQQISVTGPSVPQGCAKRGNRRRRSGRPAHRHGGASHRSAGRRGAALPGAHCGGGGGAVGRPGLGLQSGEACAQLGDRHGRPTRRPARRCHPARSVSSAALRPARSARSSKVAGSFLAACPVVREAQPLSITSRTGPLPAKAEPASSTGRASARMTSAAASHPQGHQPPGRAGRRFLSRVQAEQEADSWKIL